MQAPTRLPRICVTATGTTPGELMECARRALDEGTFVELRLDWVANPAEAIALIPRLIESTGTTRRAVMLQGTVRRTENGGRFAGAVSDQIELLHRAAEAGCRVLDLEIESAEAAGKEAVASLREQAVLILSFHDFHTTPALGAVARRLRRFPADYYKVIPTATRQSDNCAILELLERGGRADKQKHSPRSNDSSAKWIGFAMGEFGVPSRVLALARGSALAYVAPAWSSGESQGIAAPGQLDHTTLRNRYRAERLGKRTSILGVLGNPVKQSIGVAVHNAAFRTDGIDAVYLPLLAFDVSDFHDAAKRYPLSGFSVTIPHKQAILRYVDHADRWVKVAGAANTVRIRRGRWEATNTDVAGIIAPLRHGYRLGENRKLPQGFRAVIVGNGGAARAAVVGLRQLGCASIFVAGRSPHKLRSFADEMGCTALLLDALAREDFDLLIHATPVGMWPRGGESLLREDQMRAATVFDLIYNPPETRLLQLAKASGCKTISGIEMYLAQSGAQFKFWTGKDAPLRTMRQAAVTELERMRARVGS